MRIEKVREDIIKRGMEPKDDSAEFVKKFFDVESYSANEFEIVQEMFYKYNNIVEFH